ncbi:MAG: hypothetical protein CXX80_05600 [Methanobacteriota archaeon]|nr:MAG: hypothetical protein CXX80_05600 [Euryarchaeota archaeon]
MSEEPELAMVIVAPTICSRSSAIDPSIRVTHRRKKFKAGKSVMAAGGSGRFEILIMFENRSDTALKDLLIHDVVPSSFEMMDCTVRGAGRKERSDVEMTSSDTDTGLSVQWHVPVIGKDERLEVSYEIKGDGKFDAAEMQKFHGATFGDEVEDEPGLAAVAGEDSGDDSTMDPADLMKLKKAELVALAESAGLDTSGTKKDIVERLCATSEGDDTDDVADTAADSDDQSDVEPEADSGADADASEDVVEDVAGESSEGGETEADDNSDTRDCPACGTSNSASAGTCITCGFAF